MKMYFKRSFRMKKGKFWRNCCKILSFHSNSAKNYLPKKQRKSKFCVGEMRFSWGGIETWWGRIQKILVCGGGFPPSPPLGRTLHSDIFSCKQVFYPQLKGHDLGNQFYCISWWMCLKDLVWNFSNLTRLLSFMKAQAEIGFWKEPCRGLLQSFDRF